MPARYIVVADGLDPQGLQRLQAEAEVSVFAGLDESSLIASLARADAVIVRSKSHLTARVLERAPRLRVAARAGVGVDNIDVEAATRRGILVLNTPEASTTSTAEHTMAMLLALARRIPHANASVARGQWTREAFVGTELYGKTLGIAGLGKIGTEVARRAQAFGMQVRSHDPYVSEDRAARLGVDLVSFDDLLATSDVLTLHVPLTQRTRHLIGAEQIRRMKAGSLLVNCARGGLGGEGALLAALDDGHLGGAGLGGGEMEGVELLYAGEVSQEEPAPLTAAFLVGLFSGISDQPVNMISAPALARDRGIEVSEIRRTASEDFQHLLGVMVDTSRGPLRLAGTLFGRREPRITQVGDYRLDLVPAEQLLFLWNVDRPG